MMGRTRKIKKIVESSSGDMVSIDEFFKDSPKALEELVEIRKWIDENPLLFDAPKEKISQGQRKMKQLLEDLRRNSIFIQNMAKIAKSEPLYTHDSLKPLYIYRV